jgi:hypothetical protein
VQSCRVYVKIPPFIGRFGNVYCRQSGDRATASDKIDVHTAAYHTHPLSALVVMGNPGPGIFYFPIGFFDQKVELTGSIPSLADEFD